MKTSLLFIFTVFMLITLPSCTSGDMKEDISGAEVIDFYGLYVPYTPTDIEQMPEWLQSIIKGNNAKALYRICIGNYNNTLIYHLSYWTDSSYSGHFYDQKGSIITYEYDFLYYISLIKNVKCIYYKAEI